MDAPGFNQLLVIAKAMIPLIEGEEWVNHLELISEARTKTIWIVPKKRPSFQAATKLIFKATSTSFRIGIHAEKGYFVGPQKSFQLNKNWHWHSLNKKIKEGILDVLAVYFESLHHLDFGIEIKRDLDPSFALGFESLGEVMYSGGMYASTKESLQLESFEAVADWIQENYPKDYLHLFCFIQIDRFELSGLLNSEDEVRDQSYLEHFYRQHALAFRKFIKF